MPSLGRPCTVCALPQAQLLELERGIHSGSIRISQLARLNGVSVDAVYRHQRNHFQQELRVDTPESEQLPDAAELIERLVESANDLRRARHVAALGHNILSLTRAADSELRVIATLAEKLGVDAEEAPDALRNADALRHAVVAATLRNPSVAVDIAAAFRRQGRDGEASQLEEVALRAEARLKEKSEIQS